MTCLTCCRAWTEEDAAADADEIEVEATSGVARGDTKSGQDEIVLEVKEVEPQDAAAVASEDVVVGEEAEERIPQAEAIREVPPTAEEVASAVDVEELSKEVSMEPAPSSGDSGVLTKPQEDAVKRVEGDLMEGGLLLTQVMGGRKAIRRVEVDSESEVLKWEVEALFGMKWEKVKLPEARVMCTSNLVKIGVQGRREFITFEACDDDEAAAVRDVLVGHAKELKTKNL